MWMCNESHAYCCNGPAALVLSAVVIRRMIVKMLFVFLLSEVIQQVNCEITEQNRTNTLFTQGLCIQTCEDMIQIQYDDMVDS